MLITIRNISPVSLSLAYDLALAEFMESNFMNVGYDFSITLISVNFSSVEKWSATFDIEAKEINSDDS